MSSRLQSRGALQPLTSPAPGTAGPRCRLRWSGRAPPLLIGGRRRQRDRRRRRQGKSTRPQEAEGRAEGGWQEGEEGEEENDKEEDGKKGENDKDEDEDKKAKGYKMQSKCFRISQTGGKKYFYFIV